MVPPVRLFGGPPEPFVCLGRVLQHTPAGGEHPSQARFFRDKALNWLRSKVPAHGNALRSRWTYEWATVIAVTRQTELHRPASLVIPSIRISANLLGALAALMRAGLLFGWRVRGRLIELRSVNRHIRFRRSQYYV